MPRKPIKRRAMAIKQPPTRKKETKNIRISKETWLKLKQLKMIPEERHDTVIRRLIEFYEQHQAQKKPQQAEKEGFLA